MSYEKLDFEKGQVLKAEHLNHMEEGIFANAIPVYKAADITLEKAIELAKNKAVFWIEGESVTENSLDESKLTMSTGKTIVSKYYCNHAQQEDSHGCGDYEDIPAELTLYYYNTSSNHFKTFEITDEIVDEIRAAWGL